MENEQTADVTNYDITPDSLTPISSGELDLCRQWVEKKKLEEEIRTGVKLRHAKPVLPYTRELRVVDVKSKKRPPPIPTEVKNRSRNVKTLPGCKKLSSASKTNSSCNTKNCQSRKYKDCPTRIIELATPSKRHCLETWRNRSSTLPPLMLERLKKFVNDEAPVIPIGDAITCFQRKKGKAKKKPKIKSTFISERDKFEYRNISSIFGSKIVRRLMTPMKIQLKENWQRVADNVQYDTAKLMKKCCRETKFGVKMNEEVANKVTVWIATILDESEMKLLDDELEDINKIEGPVIQFIEELIDQAIAIVNEKYPAKCSDVSLYESDDETSSYADTEKISEDYVIEDAKEIKDVIRLGKSSKTYDSDITDSNNVQAEEIDDLAAVFKDAITEIVDSIENNFVDAVDVLEAAPEGINENTDTGVVGKPIEEPELQETTSGIFKGSTETEDMNAKDDGQEIVSDTADLNAVKDVSRSGSQTFQLSDIININNSEDNADAPVFPELKVPDVTIEIGADLQPIDIQNIEKDMNQIETQQLNVNVEISTPENIITDIPTIQSASKPEAVNENTTHPKNTPSKEENIIYEDIEQKQLQQDVSLSLKNSETNLLDESLLIQTKHNLATNSQTKKSGINDDTEKQEKVDDLTNESIIKLLTDTSQAYNEVDKSATNSVRNLQMESTNPPQEILNTLPSSSLTQLLIDNTGQPFEKVDKSRTDSVTQLLIDNTGQQFEKVDKSPTNSVTQLSMNNTGQPFEKVDKSRTDSVTQLSMDNIGQPFEKVDKSRTDSVTQLSMDNTGQPFEKVDNPRTDSVTNLLDENGIQVQKELEKSSTDAVLQLVIDDVKVEEELKPPRSYSDLKLLAGNENYVQQEEETLSNKLETIQVSEIENELGKRIDSVNNSDIKLLTETEERQVPSQDADIMSTDSEMKLLVKNLSRPHQSIESSFTSVTDFLGKHIHFSTPKPELLTKVDEIWPEELSRTKITANVTKSITSLGNIKEYFRDEDELKTSSAISATLKPDLDKLEKVDSNKVQKVVENVEPLKKVTKAGVDQKMEVKDDVSAKGDSNIELVPKKQIKFDYKVNPDTAPVWLRNYISDPNAKGLKTSKSFPTKEQYTNLYEAYSIMENWSQWLQNTCENIERLKTNEVSFGENRIKDWAQLKNHIDYDIARWKIFCAKTKTATRRIQSKPSCKCSTK